jgi:hypothetical protein
MGISSVTSEALQLKLRQLLPSQQGFGTDLSASDTIIPIIDLTSAAEGSDVPQYLQQALSFGSQTSFNVTNTTTALANTAGFYRVVGTAYGTASVGDDTTANFSLTDGASSKVAWQLDVVNAGSIENAFVTYDLVFFLTSGETLNAISGHTTMNLTGSIRQVADSNGTLVQPSGFTPQ